MGLFDKLNKLIHNVTLKEVVGFNGGDNNNIDPTKLAVYPQWFFSPRLGQPRDINVIEVRSFAKSPWVQMVLNTKKREVSTTPWDIVPVDPDDMDDHQETIEKIKYFFNNINTDNETIIDLGSYMITDCGEVDAVVNVLVYTQDSYTTGQVPKYDKLGNPVLDPNTGEMIMEEGQVLKPLGQRQLVQARASDGGSFLKQVDIYKRLICYYQYSYKHPRAAPIKFLPEEVYYSVRNKRTYDIYGFSEVQAIQQVLEVLIKSTKWNRDIFKEGVIPDGIVSLPGADAESMERFKREWVKEFKGKAHKLAFHNTEAKFEQFAMKSRDMEWLDGQKWFFHLVFGVFGMSPVEAGFHENVNQGNQQGQERVTVKNAIKPDLTMIERFANHLIKEFLGVENPPVKFEFHPLDHAQEQIEFDQDMGKIDRGVITINEYRGSLGLDPVEWGDQPMNMAMASMMSGDPLEDEEPRDNEPGGEKDKPELPEEKQYSRFKKQFEDFITP